MDASKSTAAASHLQAPLWASSRLLDDAESSVAATGSHLHPPLSALPSLVDAAIREVRLHMYDVPDALADAVDLQQKTSNCRIRNKHPWINLEDRIWKLMPSAIWTNDPEEATFHVVPNAYLGHQCGSSARDTQRYVREAMMPFLEYIVHGQPYYNRTGGRNHIVTSVFENGPQCDCAMRPGFYHANETGWHAYEVMMSMIKIGHWAHRDVDMFRWEAGFDIAVPQFGAVRDSFGPFPPPKGGLSKPSWQEVVSNEAKYSFGFSGSYWGSAVTCPADKSERGPLHSLGASHRCECSPGTRSWLQQYLRRSCNTSSTPTTRCKGLAAPMGSFFYALCPAAWACWSSRTYHAIDNLAVPVVMANGMISPFEDILDWRSFSVTLDTTEFTVGNSSAQLDTLHDDALATRRFCSACPTCANCTQLPLVKRVRQLEKVRPWFLYNGTAPYNVLGLILLELHCRQVHAEDTNGVCRPGSMASPASHQMASARHRQAVRQGQRHGALSA